nr:hypothetical protein [Alicyclobacillus shizuokensis]
MAIRSIRVKLWLSARPDIRAGLWRLHKVTNAGVRYYAEWLCLMRQESFCPRAADGTLTSRLTAQDCQWELLRRLRERQRCNGRHDLPGTDAELLALARELYETLVPQSRGKAADALQLARNFFSPLVDANSVGGKGESRSGRKPVWKKMREEGHPGWQAARDEYERRKAADPSRRILGSLQDLGLRPLFAVFTQTCGADIEWKPLGKSQGVRTWDRDMFQQALERLTV